MKPIATYLRRHKHFLHQRLPHAEVQFPAGTFGPGAIPTAYQFPSNQGTPKAKAVYGIVSLGGTFSQTDAIAYCKIKGWPVPILTQFTIGGGNATSDPGGANVENMLDVQMILQAWHTAYPTIPCIIYACTGPNVGTGIAQVAQALLNRGCTDISCSWGAAEQEWDSSSRSTTENVLQAIRAGGYTFCAASGDSSEDDGERAPSCDYPAGSAYAWSCGGTNTVVNGSIVTSKAWGDGRPGDEGGGGGFDKLTPIPTWQNGIVGGSYRGSPDSSANADPDTGYQIYADGAWGVVGGTSASAPLTCGLFGVLRSMGLSLSNYWLKFYAAPALAWDDVTIGSNGLPAAKGWDASTGLGVPDGPGIVSVLSPVQPSPPIPPMPPVNPPSTTITLSAALPAGTYTISSVSSKGASMQVDPKQLAADFVQEHAAKTGQQFDRALIGGQLGTILQGIIGQIPWTKVFQAIEIAIPLLIAGQPISAVLAAIAAQLGLPTVPTLAGGSGS